MAPAAPALSVPCGRPGWAVSEEGQCGEQRPAGQRDVAAAVVPTWTEQGPVSSPHSAGCLISGLFFPPRSATVWAAVAAQPVRGQLGGCSPSPGPQCRASGPGAGRKRKQSGRRQEGQRLVLMTVSWLGRRAGGAAGLCCTGDAAGVAPAGADPCPVCSELSAEAREQTVLPGRAAQWD